MVRRVRSARANQWCGRAMQGCRKKVHAVERGFWSASMNMYRSKNLQQEKEVPPTTEPEPYECAQKFSNRRKATLEFALVRQRDVSNGSGFSDMGPFSSDHSPSTVNMSSLGPFGYNYFFRKKWTLPNGPHTIETCWEVYPCYA